MFLVYHNNFPSHFSLFTLFTIVSQTSQIFPPQLGHVLVLVVCQVFYQDVLPITVEPLTQTHILFCRIVTFANNVLEISLPCNLVEETYLLNIPYTHFNTIGIFKISLLSEVDIFSDVKQVTTTSEYLVPIRFRSSPCIKRRKYFGKYTPPPVRFKNRSPSRGWSIVIACQRQLAVRHERLPRPQLRQAYTKAVNIMLHDIIFWKWFQCGLDIGKVIVHRTLRLFAKFYQRLFGRCHIQSRSSKKQIQSKIHHFPKVRVSLVGYSCGQIQTSEQNSLLSQARFLTWTSRRGSGYGPSPKSNLVESEVEHVVLAFGR